MTEILHIVNILIILTILTLNVPVPDKVKKFLFQYSFQKWTGL